MPPAPTETRRRRQSYMKSTWMWGQWAPRRGRVRHAMVVIFLEFFAIGLLSTILPDLFSNFFKNSMFLVSGVSQGVKGLLSFLCAPLLGMLSDFYGRKVFLLVAVFFTCLPIPFLLLSSMWYYTIVFAVSGIFSVTFSIVFAYASDITEESERSAAYGKITAMFAASLVTAPFVGVILARYSAALPFIVATAISLLDIMYIWFFVPESLPDAQRHTRATMVLDWRQGNPFVSLGQMFRSRALLRLSAMVFFSYLPEAGQQMLILQYLDARFGFTKMELAAYIGCVGILAILAQTVVLRVLSTRLGDSFTVQCGLALGIAQLLLFGVAQNGIATIPAGALAALSSITYPALSALVSRQSDPEQQGAMQGLVTGIRMLCNGLGPALFGVLFQAVGFTLSVSADGSGDPAPATSSTQSAGLPFLVGAALVFIALVISRSLPELDEYASVPVEDGEEFEMVSAGAGADAAVVVEGAAAADVGPKSRKERLPIAASTSLELESQVGPLHSDTDDS